MGVDNYTTVVFGWKVEGYDKVKKLQKKLEEIDEDYYDTLENYIVDDPMCGNYIYFGAILAHYDAIYSDEEEIIIDDELSKACTSRYNKFMDEHPQFKEVFKEYQEKDPQLYVFQNIW